MNKQNGYIVDTTYPAFFYKEMQPIWLSTIVNFLGFTSPSINQRFSYLELACGTGLNLLGLCCTNLALDAYLVISFQNE